ncbi:MAG: transcriptional repressor [Myxococcales bacterium]|nr:transcriptional repressor [Myxococcales bacterium]MCB9750398.1 transcriptional repressor [Myxococcales bacterium]
MQARRHREQAEVDALMDQFHAYLAKNQLKSTRQRDLIAYKFFSTEGHISIEELLALSRTENPRIGYATVYRTLKLLTECGLAAMRRFGDGQTMYETAGDTEHHDHLICIECGHVLEFQNEEIEREQERVARSFGFNLVRHRLELYGMCPKARGIKGGSCPHDDASKSLRALRPSRS